MTKLTSLYFLLLLPTLALAQPKIQLVNFVSGFSRPVDIAHCGDSRLFIVQQNGIIWIVDSLGNKLPQPFLDIDARVNSTGNEQGLLGLAFHPNYAQNGYFYVHYSQNNGGDTRVARFSRDSGDANKADPNSELVILEQDQPYSNHNGGCLKFGPDGYLYTGLGDGGNAGDPLNSGQTKNTLLGKILRIDINSSSPAGNYAIPADNPFVNDPAFRPEIWSWGLRNPWRFSLDRLTGDMWIGDVGQNAREEIDFEPANTPGRNYGWRCYEGPQTYNNNGCPPASSFIPPAYAYVNPSIGCSITGGFIYRGSKYADLYGVYLFADYCSGRVWGTRRNADGTFTTTELANLGDYEFSSFGEDRNGELYVALLSSGKVQKITEICSPFQVESATVTDTICPGYNGVITVNMIGTSGTVNYAWSNGTNGPNTITSVLPGTYTVTATNGNGCSRTSTFEIVGLPFIAPQLVGNDTAICAGSALSYTIKNPSATPIQLTYQINGVPNNVTLASFSEHVINITPLMSTQIVLVSAQNDECNIPLTDQVFIQVYAPTAVPIISIQGNTLTAEGGTWITYQWLLNGTPIQDADSSSFTATQSGVYQVIVNDVNGCPAQSSSLNLTVSGTDALPASVLKCTVSPNPGSGIFNL
ncbi:MAG: PQQ-dependent sugar dehydrogenase, partial [Saprospiraceae bacterium]|nr:PQQ-dependent sugar dehydrogenase [Saprospiraceae bacterium]